MSDFKNQIPAKNLRIITWEIKCAKCKIQFSFLPQTKQDSKRAKLLFDILETGYHQIYHNLMQ